MYAQHRSKNSSAKNPGDREVRRSFTSVYYHIHIVFHNSKNIKEKNKYEMKVK